MNLEICELSYIKEVLGSATEIVVPKAAGRLSDFFVLKNNFHIDVSLYYFIPRLCFIFRIKQYLYTTVSITVHAYNAR